MIDSIGLTVMEADKPPVFQAFKSGSLFQPLTKLACRVRLSFTFRLARTPVCSSGMALNSSEREYSQFLLASMTSAPAVVVNLPKSRVKLGRPTGKVISPKACSIRNELPTAAEPPPALLMIDPTDP